MKPDKLKAIMAIRIPTKSKGKAGLRPPGRPDLPDEDEGLPDTDSDERPDDGGGTDDMGPGDMGASEEGSDDDDHGGLGHDDDALSGETEGPDDEPQDQHSDEQLAAAKDLMRTLKSGDVAGFCDAMKAWDDSKGMDDGLSDDDEPEGGLPLSDDTYDGGPPMSKPQYRG